ARICSIRSRRSSSWSISAGSSVPVSPMSLARTNTTGVLLVAGLLSVVDNLVSVEDVSLSAGVTLVVGLSSARDVPLPIAPPVVVVLPVPPLEHPASATSKTTNTAPRARFRGSTFHIGFQGPLAMTDRLYRTMIKLVLYLCLESYICWNSYNCPSSELNTIALMTTLIHS